MPITTSRLAPRASRADPARNAQPAHAAAVAGRLGDGRVQVGCHRRDAADLTGADVIAPLRITATAAFAGVWLSRQGAPTMPEHLDKPLWRQQLGPIEATAFVRRQGFRRGQGVAIMGVISLRVIWRQAVFGCFVRTTEAQAIPVSPAKGRCGSLAPGCRDKLAQGRSDRVDSHHGVGRAKR
jgi:hypothetical protein